MLGFRPALRKSFLTGLLTLLAAAPAFASEKPISKHPAGQQAPVKTSISVVTPDKSSPASAQAAGATSASAQPEAAPAPPPPPPTLAQMPAVPPTVEYQAGKLTIIAENSTLGDILRAVRQKSGAAVEVPANATERVVIHMGPAPIHDVLVSLLDGSSFNYVMVGSPNDPNAVTRVVLTPKPAGGPEVASAAAPTQPPPMAAPQPFAGAQRNFGNNAPEADADTDGQENNDDADDQPPPAPDQAPQADGQSPDADGQPGAPGVVKTPQQMLEELQRQQQQQQLIQQQQQSIEGSTPIGGPPNSAQQ